MRGRSKGTEDPRTTSASAVADTEPRDGNWLQRHVVEPLLDLWRGLAVGPVAPVFPPDLHGYERLSVADVLERSALEPDARAVVDDAVQRAAVSGEHRPTATHMIHALLDAPALKDLHRALGTDASAVLEEWDKRVPSRSDWDLVRFLHEVGWRAAATSAGRVNAGDLLAVTLLSLEEARDAFRAGGADQLRVLTFHSHNVLAHEPLDHESISPAESLIVCMHNDNYTPQEVVVDVLEGIFGLSRRTAATTMFRVHKEGEAVVGAYPRWEAIAFVNRAQQVARHLGWPLKITVQPR